MLENLKNIINGGFSDGGEIMMSSKQMLALLDILDEYESLKRVTGSIGCLLVEGEIDVAIEQICELEGYSREHFKIVNKLNSVDNF